VDSKRLAIRCAADMTLVEQMVSDEHPIVKFLMHLVEIGWASASEKAVLSYDEGLLSFRPC
jgi:hypothetical protein